MRPLVRGQVLRIPGGMLVSHLPLFFDAAYVSFELFLADLGRSGWLALTMSGAQWLSVTHDAPVAWSA